jgi:hypothetical protein
MSKGSKPRPLSVSQKQFEDNFDKIFRRKEMELDPVVIDEQRYNDPAPQKLEPLEDRVEYDTDLAMDSYKRHEMVLLILEDFGEKESKNYHDLGLILWGFVEDELDMQRLRLQRDSK